ncbi:hypothetical protein [Pelomonas cellulosilytica]|uniref:MFS transporter n=1 Tax=Pelomonas cellulosilytica TaxID=2906762 RepID=A0ABS8XUA7_9BURK|nr:hypothetical protein [Pelomonas sp. P8]MCE4554308.1 hypothetical protein [Pelomonas sp. P8]
MFAQHHFWRHPQEALWTSVVLLGGAVAALLGLSWSEFGPGANTRAALWLGWPVFATSLLLAGTDAVSGAPGFAVLMWVLCFSTSLLMQEFDARSVEQAGFDERVSNDLCISLLRFVGMLLAPCAFSVVTPGGWGAALLMLALASIVALSGWRLLATESPAVQQAAQSPAHTQLRLRSQAAKLCGEQRARPPSGASMSWAERRLWAAGVVVYANYCVLASAAPFLLRDLLVQPQAMERAWVLVSLVYAAAMLCNGLVQWRRWQPRIGWLRVAPATLAVAAACLCSPGAAAVGSWWTQGVASVALGAAFGLFMMGYRNHVTRLALDEGRPEMVSRYNRMPRWATLLAFAVLAALAAGSSRTAPSLSTSVAGYLLASSLLLTLFATRWAGTPPGALRAA